MSDAELTSEDVRNLADVGFLALSHGLIGHAAAVFEGLRAARPAEEAGVIGLAMIHLANNQPDAAVAGLKALPPSDAALTFLGIALARLGDLGEARQKLAMVIRTAPGTPHAELAQSVLAELGA
jgi:thioredoxin-like negative regulator of GroEL